MLDVQFHKSFKKDFKLMQKLGYDMALLLEVIDILRHGLPLPHKNRDLALIDGEYRGCRECHIQPDWLLVYRVKADVLVLELLYTGTHSDLL